MLKALLLILMLSTAPLASGSGGWQLLAGEPARQGGPNSAGIAQIFDGMPTSDYPAVAGIAVLLGGGLVGYCSGTLVSPSVVLTAAHCVAGGPLAISTVLFPGGGVRAQYNVVEYAIEPEYSSDVLAVADLALLLLETPVADIAPIPLATRTPRSGSKSIIVGYGEDASGSFGLKEFGTVRLKKCPRTFAPAGLVRGQLSRSLCWRPKQRHQDTCPGDSGGPPLVKSTPAGVTAGVCPDCPGVLSWDTNVVPFLPWINDHLR